MTGRDLIIYILENNLENEEILKDGKPLGFVTVKEAAKQMHVGPETIKTMVKMGTLPSIRLGDSIFIPARDVYILKAK